MIATNSSRPARKRAALGVGRRGVVYLASLAIMVILMGFGLSFLFVTRSHTLISAKEIQRLKTFYLAEAGVEHSLGDLLYGVAVGEGDGNIGTVYGLQPIGNYHGSYDDSPGLKIIEAQGVRSSDFCVIQAKINDSGIDNAVLAGQGFYFYDTIGTINGNAEFGNGDVGDFPEDDISVIGEIKYHGEDISAQIPDPDLLNPSNGYAVNADYTFSGPQNFTAADFSSYPPLASGIYYFENDLTVTGPDPVNIDGTLVVVGNLAVDMWTPPSVFSVNPYLTGYPAVIVQGSFESEVSGPCQMDFGGLVFADWIYWEFLDKITIDGALVSRTSIEMQYMSSPDNLTIAYNPDLTTPYFIGGKKGEPVIVSWQGHRD